MIRSSVMGTSVWSTLRWYNQGGGNLVVGWYTYLLGRPSRAEYSYTTTVTKTKLDTLSRSKLNGGHGFYSYGAVYAEHRSIELLSQRDNFTLCAGDLAQSFVNRESHRGGPPPVHCNSVGSQAQ